MAFRFVAFLCVLITTGIFYSGMIEQQECNHNNDGDRSLENVDSTELDAGEFQCGIYLAPSSIPNAGFGIFTTRPIAKDEPIQPYPEAPSIVVTDFETLNQEEDWNHVSYIWSPMGVAAFEADVVSESAMTYGSLCNYHPVSLRSEISMKTILL